MKVIAEDALYNLGQDLGNNFNKGITAFANKGKTDEQKLSILLTLKKTIHNLDTYTRAIAVGLKPLIAIANWFGNHFQMFINSEECIHGDNLKETMQELLLEIFLKLKQFVRFICSFK
jgi:hypothetical protein